MKSKSLLGGGDVEMWPCSMGPFGVNRKQLPEGGGDSWDATLVVHIREIELPEVMDQEEGGEWEAEQEADEAEEEGLGGLGGGGRGEGLGGLGGGGRRGGDQGIKVARLRLTLPWCIHSCPLLTDWFELMLTKWIKKVKKKSWKWEWKWEWISDNVQLKMGWCTAGRGRPWTLVILHSLKLHTVCIFTHSEYFYAPCAIFPLLHSACNFTHSVQINTQCVILHTMCNL